MGDHDESPYTYGGGEIESLADILDIMNRPNEFLGEIIDLDPENAHKSDPLGRNHHGAPRPFPHGIWFRGQADAGWAPVPSVFRRIWEKSSEENQHLQFYDEREMFTDIRLRASNVDLRGFSNIELMCLMQHHALPTRLMDWSESPLVAAFFATSRQYYDATPYFVQPEETRGMKAERPAALYVLNAYRLNALTNLSLHSDSNIFHPKDIDVVIRALMAEHTYLESVFSKIYTLEYVANDRVAIDVEEMAGKLDKIMSGRKASSIESMISFIPELRKFYHRLSAPVAVIPRRDHARMHAQLSCFTMHGGKLTYDSVFREEKIIEKMHKRKSWNFIPDTLDLHQINGPESQFGHLMYSGEVSNNTQFMKKFIISKHAVGRIMIELDRMGINESMIYPDIENQSRYVKRRWATIHKDRPIWSLPRLNAPMGPRRRYDDVEVQGINDMNYMKHIYGKE